MMRVTTALVLLTACRLFTRELASDEGCQQNSDCPGQLCWFSECISATADPSDAIYVRMQPTGNQEMHAQEQELTILNGRANIAWTKAAVIDGRATVVSGLPPSGIGWLRLSKPSAIPGSTQIVEVLVNTSYSAKVEPGTYTALFSPDPQSLFGQVRLANWDIHDDEKKDIEIPVKTTQVEGTLLSSQSEASPRAQATVFGIAAGGLLSTVATSTDTGAFTLFFAGAPTGATLFVFPGKLNPFLPDVSFTVQMPGTNTKIAPLYIPDIGSTATIEGKVLGSIDGSSFPLPAADVRAETNIGGGIYHANTQTDASGRFSLAVIRAASDEVLDYTIRVEPALSAPPDVNQEFGVGETHYPLGHTAALPNAEIVLPPRQALSGIVKDHTGALLQNLTVTAQRVSDGKLRRVTTSSQGEYNMPLDPGAYEVSFVPVAGSKLARTQLRVNMVNESKTLDVALPVPMLLAGEISGQGVSFAGMLLTFMRIENGEPVVIGEGTVRSVSAELGHFSVALPKEQLGR